MRVEVENVSQASAVGNIVIAAIPTVSGTLVAVLVDLSVAMLLGVGLGIIARLGNVDGHV